MRYEYLGTSDYHGRPCERFTLDGRESLLAVPESPLPGNPWVWRAEFFGAFDTVDAELLRRGWHVAYHCVSDQYGCPASVGRMRGFAEYMTAERGLARRPSIFGFSRGGLYAVNYALRYPADVSSLYLDAPVLDISDWPCRFADRRESAECLALYGLTRETLPGFRENPLDRVDELAAAGVPVFVVAGDADAAVRFERNGKPFAERLAALGADIGLIVKPGCDHHPHSLEDPTPVADFVSARFGG